MSLRNFFRQVFFKTQRAVQRQVFQSKIAGCGHKFLPKDEITALGRTITTGVPLDENGSTPYCHCCLAEMVVPCAWCHEPIFIGNPITLYIITEKKLKNEYGFSDQEMEQYKKDGELPDGSIIYKASNGWLTLVGCGYTDCADTGADYSGTWMPPGKVERFASMIELGMQSNANAVFAENCSKPETFQVL